jgi:eukaryotic-like serine/threonine-protein kinase
MAGTGRVIAGRYRLKGPIGRGAMGTVWRAWDEVLDREVAVKELRISDGLDPDERAKAYQRTHREARTAARLSHPGLVTVFDVAEEDGRPWIIMELVAAPSLDQIIAHDGPLPPGRAADAGRQLLAALATAHAARVLHRDVKPSNVLLADGGRAVLTDFGIATFQGDPKLTQTGMVMGSPGFTAPERIQGNPATPASDLWSLGATLYAAVEGHGPFDRVGGAITTMSAIINSDPPSAPAAAGLGSVIDALLRRNPGDRPDAATAARMLGAVGPLAGASGHGNVFTPFRPRRPESGSPGDAGAAPSGEPFAGAPGAGDGQAPGPGGEQSRAADAAPAPAPAGPAPPDGGQSPGAEARPKPDTPRPGPTSVDLPVQGDQTIPVHVPGSLRAAADQAASHPSPGTDDRPADDGSGFSGAPGQTRGGAQAESISEPWGSPAPGSTGQPWGSAAPGNTGQPWGSASAGSAARPWGATPAESGGGSWGAAAPPSRAGQAPESASAWGAAPDWGAAPPGGATAAVQARGRPRRTALVWFGVVVLAVAAAAGLLAFRALHRTGPGATTGQNGSSAARTTPESPVTAAGGPASLGTPPAGYHFITVTAAELGSTAGFTVAMPDTWTVVTRGTGKVIEAPGGTTYLQIDLTPHTYADMLVEARYLSALTRKQGHFPGYTGLGIHPANIRGGRGAAWNFAWQSASAGRVRVLDLMYIASTPTGRQSFALYLSSPDPAWNSSLPAFDEAMRTFRPIP